MHVHANTRPGLEKCDRCLIGHRAVCGVADSETLAELNKLAQPRRYPAGTTIIHAGEPTPFVGNVLTGVVKLTKTLADGRRQIVGLLFASDFVGRAFDGDWPFAAEAATDVALCTFPRPEFEKLLLSAPALEHHLLVAALDELDAARDWMLLLGCKTAEEKVASFLLFIAKRSARHGACLEPQHGQPQFELPISRSDMAAYLGTTVETISRQITRLKTENIIRLTDMHHFIVPDLGRLAAAAGLD